MRRNFDQLKRHWMLRRAVSSSIPEIIRSECQKEIEKIWAHKHRVWKRNEKLRNLRKKLKVP